MKSDLWIVRLATLGPLGYLIAPGTVATLLTLPFVYLINQWVEGNNLIYFIIFLLFTAIAFFIIQRALIIIKRHDNPDEIILDDIIGCLLTFWMIPLTAQSLIVGFILFRCFAIPKWGLIKGSEELPGAWGVIGDDVIAALVTNIILRFLF
jgi:phosphatidylglycerophosphatase A